MGCSCMYVCMYGGGAPIFRSGGQRQRLFSGLANTRGTVPGRAGAPTRPVPPALTGARSTAPAGAPGAGGGRRQPRGRCRCPPRGVTAGQAAAAARRGCGAGSGLAAPGARTEPLLSPAPYPLAGGGRWCGRAPGKGRPAGFEQPAARQLFSPPSVPEQKRRAKPGTAAGGRAGGRAKLAPMPLGVGPRRLRRPRSPRRAARSG